MSTPLSTSLPFLLRMTVALALGGVAGASLAADPVRESFDRLLAHESTLGSSAGAPRTEADPLVALVVMPLRDGTAAPVAARAAIADDAKDPVTQSFARMLNHEPSRFMPARPDRADVDPLIAAVVLPLLRAQSVAVAGAGHVVHP